MAGFADRLSPDAIAAVAAYLAQPLAEAPVWTAEDITATRTMAPAYACRPGAGVQAAIR